MKKSLIALVVFTLVAIDRAEAVLPPPYFGDIRNQVINQLAIASNAPVLDKKLVTSLRKALTLIEKANPTDVVSDTKTLTMLTATLNKSSLSNVFDSYLQGVVDIYVNVLLGQGANLIIRLEATFPSGPHNGAENNLEQLFAALENAHRIGNSTLAAKALSLAAKKAVVAAKLITKAEAVPPPPAGVTANISGAVNTRFKYNTGSPVFELGLGFLVDAVQTTLHPIAQRRVTFELPNVGPGNNSINITGGVFEVIAVPAGEVTYDNGTGTANVSLNAVTQTLYGTFTFTATRQGGGGTVTVTGTFLGSY